MAYALSLSATYSTPKGGRIRSPLGARARPPHYWPRSSLISSCSPAFALPRAYGPSAFIMSFGRAFLTPLLALPLDLRH
jgi:hypothetical protein